MFVDIPTVIVFALVLVAAWQQYNIIILHNEVDETIDKHNDLVDAVNTAFGELTDALREIKND